MTIPARPPKFPLQRMALQLDIFNSMTIPTPPPPPPTPKDVCMAGCNQLF